MNHLFVRCRMSNSAVSEVFSCEAVGLGTVARQRLEEVSLHAALLPSFSSSALKVISALA